MSNNQHHHHSGVINDNNNNNNNEYQLSSNGHFDNNSTMKQHSKNYLANISHYVKQIPWSEVTSYFQPQNNDSQYNINQNQDVVIWTNFVSVEIHEKNALSVHKKLYLILTYMNGFQVFDINNEPKGVHEIASVREGPIRFATVISPPFNSIFYDESELLVDDDDSFAVSMDHPLLAVM
jgi:hypothetical protein